MEKKRDRQRGERERERRRRERGRGREVERVEGRLICFLFKIKQSVKILCHGVAAVFTLG